MLTQVPVIVAIYVFRILLYLLATVIRKCRLLVIQIMIIASLLGPKGYLNTRFRKCLAAVFIFLVILLYMWPSWLRMNYGPGVLTPVDLCIDAKLQGLRPTIDDFSAVFVYDDNHRAKFVPFVGNGYIGISTESVSPLYIKHGRYLSAKIEYYPMVTPKLIGFPQKSESIINLRDGTLIELQCHQSETGCISITKETYAHRYDTTLLIQEFRIYNPTNAPVSLDFLRRVSSLWKDTKTTVKKINADDEEPAYSLTIGSVHATSESKTSHYAVVIGASLMPETVTVKAGSSWQYKVITCIEYAAIDPTGESKLFNILEENVIQKMNEYMKKNKRSLKELHISIWNRLWSSGISISRSMALNALNGDRINSTMYYVMSHFSAPLHEKSTSSSKKDQISNLLYYPDRCYGGHHTVQNEKLWSSASDVESLNQFVLTWIITLMKQGCSTMLQAGADGVLQAMLLSVGGFKFSNDHLEYATHPADLHRNYFFRRLNYGNNTHLNISVIVGEDNKNLMFVALDRNDKPYYACDAGCLDPPHKLSQKLSLFPVKLTKPLTPILYITSDHQHMEELKHAIHVQEIAFAPAHEHHVMALHRHGHHFGGLPMLFWASITFLIVVFHLFLFKIVINEYCSGDNKYSSNRTRYQV